MAFVFPQNQLVQKPEKNSVTVGKLPLDVDFIRMLNEFPEYPLYQRRITRPTYNVGDRLAILETWAKIGSCVYYLADFTKEEEQTVKFLYPWEYSNKMPMRYAKRFVIVRDIEKLTAAEYRERIKEGQERPYNKTCFAISSAILPYDRWFRQGFEPAPLDEAKPLYLVTFEYISGSEIPTPV